MTTCKSYTGEADALLASLKISELRVHAKKLVLELANEFNIFSGSTHPVMNSVSEMEFRNKDTRSNLEYSIMYSEESKTESSLDKAKMAAVFYNAACCVGSHEGLGNEWLGATCWDAPEYKLTRFL